MGSTHWSPVVELALVTIASAATYRFVVSPSVRLCSLWLMPRRDAMSPGPTGKGSAASVRDRVIGDVWPREVVAALILVLSGVAVVLVRDAPSAGRLRSVPAAVVALLTWKVVTSDFDPRRSVKSEWVDRICLLVAAAVSVVSPPAVLVWIAIACGRLRGWTHHAMMPIRLLKCYLSWWLASGVLGVVAGLTDRHRAQNAPAAALLLLFGTVSLSHYLKAARSKIVLGPKPWSWAVENRTHALIATTYNCGWARVLPEKFVLLVLERVRRFVIVLNVAALAVELSPVVAFAHPHLFALVLFATVVFHGVIVLCTGVLFWENSAVNIALLWAVVPANEPEVASAFGLVPTLLALGLMGLCLFDLVWQPFDLGWWDGPLTTRIRWRAVTASGKTFEIGNDFMCPFERDFGRWMGMFLVPEPVLGGPSWGAHLWDRDVRDLMRRAVPDLEAVDRLKAQFGKTWWNPEEADSHEAFLKLMFRQLNEGRRKGPLSPRLRWLKAPGGYLFFWDDLPRYRGRERVARVVITCEERCYSDDTNELVLLRHRILREFPISERT